MKTRCTDCWTAPWRTNRRWGRSYKKSLGAGIRLRRRRRARNAAVCVAGVAVIAAVIPAVSGALGRISSGHADARTGPVMVYVAGGRAGTVTPIPRPATKRVSRSRSALLRNIVFTPNGKNGVRRQ